MTLLESVVCGIVQGLTEFLPVSSSGHLALAHSFFEVESPQAYLTFDLLLHLSTLLVVFAVYRKDFCALIPAFFSLASKCLQGKVRVSTLSASERLALLLVIATFPLVFAVFAKDTVEWIAGYPRVVGATLLLNGGILLLADRTSHPRGRENACLASLGIGCFQLLAIVPGLSRSGTTISGGLLLGMERKEAVRFSFLLSVPAILGANLFRVPAVLSSPVSRGELGIYLSGMAAAAIVGFAAMKLLILISEKSKFGFFAYYCMIVGLAAVIFG